MTINSADGPVVALLINPPTPSFVQNNEFILPTSLLCLAAYAEVNGFNVSILDMNIHDRDGQDHDKNNDRYREIIRESMITLNPQAVGVGCLFSGQFPFVDSTLQYIKENWPDTVTCTGGIHPTIFTSEVLENCHHIDYVVIGEGEEQFVEILHMAMNPDQALDPHMGGIGYREHGHPVVRPKTTFNHDLDALPIPAYDLINFDDYRHDLSQWHNPKGQSFDITIPVISSRSCPNKCNFCSMFLVMGPKFRARSARSVVDEIEFLYNEHHCCHFSFMDDNLTFSKKRTIDICNEIVRRKLDIQFDTPNGLMVRTLDQDVIDALVSAGWVRGSIAIESGSDYIRNTIARKNMTSEKIFDVIESIKKHPHVFLRAYFIMGFPEETRETLDESYAMIKKLGIDEVYVNNLLPFPGTELFRQCVQDDLLIGFKPENIWRADAMYTTGNKTFFIKPYKMSLEDLNEYRLKFDLLLDSIKQEGRAKMHEIILSGWPSVPRLL